MWPSLLRGGLSLGTMAYGTVTSTRNWLFDLGWKTVHRAACPVISIGNLTVGGTGKTPMVEYVARHFRQQERRVVILSRGYGATHGRNDEAMVLEDNLPDVPHLQGIDRVALARMAPEELESEVIVLDDGFQYRRLARDLDLVLIDATQPWGHGWQLPRGLLRESIHGLARADAVVLTRCDQVDPEAMGHLRAEAQRRMGSRPVFLSEHVPEVLMDAQQQTEPTAALAGKTVAAFCGIGNPEAFFRMLRGLGADVRLQRTFADHHPYSRADVQALERWAEELPPDGWVVTTQKDLVKLRVPTLGRHRLLAVKIAIRLRESLDSFHSLLDRVFHL